MTTPTRVRSAVLARAHYLRQQRLVRRTVESVQALWRAMGASSLTASWQVSTGPAIVAAVSAGQREAAGGADEYVAAFDPDGDGAPRIRPGTFAAVASDGRPLESLLYLPVITTKQHIAAGQTASEAMLAGLHQLLRMTATQVADAGRTAVGASIAGRRTIQGYIRIAAAPCCARCAILSGREYGWNAGFQRHPRCDCYHVPATLIARGRGRNARLDTSALPSNAVVDARHYFTSLSRTEQDRIFTAAGAQAIRDGADIAQVVNARRGMNPAGTTTRESTTRRGLFFRQEFRRLQQQGVIPAGASSRGYTLPTPRLMPETIYRLAADRDEAIAMLRRFGYLT